MIIKINNFIVSGIHGLTEGEKDKPQRFKVDVEVQSRDSGKIEDNISRTFDYRKIKKDIVEIVEGEKCMLIETICEKIVDKISKCDQISAVKVEVGKIDIWGNGFPSVVMSR